MLLDCEKGCTKYAWSLGGHCPDSYANDDGGFWCWELCGNVRPEVVTDKTTSKKLVPRKPDKVKLSGTYSEIMTNMMFKGW